MPCPADLHVVVDLLRHGIVRIQHHPLWLVPPIGNVKLIPVEYLIQSILRNLLITPRATSKRTMEPNDPSGGNTNPDFVSHARPLEFVGIPTRRKGRRLLNLKVCTIDRDKDITIGLCLVFPVLPVDLQNNNMVSVIGRRKIWRPWNYSF